MRLEEYEALRIGDLLIHRDTGALVVLHTQWALPHTAKPEDYLWTNDVWGRIPRCDYNGGDGVAVRAKECADWDVVRAVEDVMEDPVAYCNYLHREVVLLKNQLRHLNIR